MILEMLYWNEMDDDEPHRTRNGKMEDKPDACRTETSTTDVLLSTVAREVASPVPRKN